MDLFRVTLNCIDHYQTIPTRFDPQLRSDVSISQTDKEPAVPVIRIFGSTETGQKVCAHIHGAFPYLYVEYTGSLVSDEVGIYLQRLHLSIDFALAVSYRRNLQDGKAKFVARITLVKGIPFYGFHVGYRYYLKIYMLNPMVMSRLADLLRQGVIMKKIFQPYEAHLQYLLQWMTDYNLYGCGYVDCSKVSFRGPVPQHKNITNLAHLWHDRSVPEDLITTESQLPRVSHCSLEVDICVQDILNRQSIKPRPLHHDFIEHMNPLAPGEKLVHSMAGLWRDETRRRKSRMSNPDPGSSPFPAEVMISMSADPRNSQPGGWIHEEEYREELAALIHEESCKSDGARLSFETFVKPTVFETTVKTSLESVEDLFPDNLLPALGLVAGHNGPNMSYSVDGGGSREVDENIIMHLMNESNDDTFYDSDEDTMREIIFSQRKGDQVESNISSKPNHGSDAQNISDDHKSQTPEALDEIMPRNSFHSLEMEELTHHRNEKPGALDRKQRPSKRATSSEDTSPSPRKRLRLSNHDDNTANFHVQPIAPDLMFGVSKYGALAEGNHSIIKMISEQENPSRDCSHKLISRTVNALAQNGDALPGGDGAFHKVSAIPEQAPPPLLNLPMTKDSQDICGLHRLSQRSAKPDIDSCPESKHMSAKGFLSVPQFKRKRPLFRWSEVRSSRDSSPIAVSRLIEERKSQSLHRARRTILTLMSAPPSKVLVTSTIPELQLPTTIYQEAFYSVEMDVPDRTREWAGREFRLEGITVPFLPDFDATSLSEASIGKRSGIIPDRTKEDARYQEQRSRCSLRSWLIAEPPPTYSQVSWWSRQQVNKQRPWTKHAIKSQVATNRTDKKNLSQVDGPTQKGKHGFKYTQNQKAPSVKYEAQHMSIMSLEIHVNTRGNFLPNPEVDEVQCVFWCLQTDDIPGMHLGVVVLSEDSNIELKIEKQLAAEVHAESSELDLMIRIVDIVRRHDPDILTGYEVHSGSWGYLIERARLQYDYNLCDELSRMKSQSHGRFGKDKDKWGFNNTSTIRVTGRHMINIWRAMRGELNLLQYTLENVAFHLLHRRIPHFTWSDLTSWYTNGRPRDLAKVIQHYAVRVQLDLEVLESNELVARTSEQARLLGVDFFSVLSRGSQFKVESLMFRIAKPENFLLVSPSREQVGSQNALECLPLVMEPQSAFYTSPLLVLDFQSLYPSVMIAYNYCYSTYLGRIVNWRGKNKMGFTEFKRQKRLLELLKDHINIAPNGIMYAKPQIRKSLLAKMLGEILETRVMVKNGMKIDKDDKALQRLLNNRQLALKLIANVTYGYTSASFSGRMPCSEIADSIVQTGRETLERAIALIHSIKRWGAEVVYGDTDSIFVYLKGRSKDEAFDIGEEIAKTITSMSPRPIKLKFEKVYFPCVLLAKKRYVGFKYETRDQSEPDFDAKGIETVRRDGTPAEQKIEEKALKILFRTSDLSQVKNYFQEQCDKILRGSVSIQDFCFAREVKLGTYSDKGPPPPGALISTKRMLEDARAEPQYGERVPYVVVTGAPGARLIDRCVAPEELLSNDHCELDAEYYISKNLIPPLERIFNLVGANVRSWYDEMPKVQRIRRLDASLQLQGLSKEVSLGKKTLESYMKASSCLVCKEKLEDNVGICSKCLQDEATSLLALQWRLDTAEADFLDLQRICQSCAGHSPLDDVRCDSKDCPVFYTRSRQQVKFKTEKAIIEPVMKDLSGSRVEVSALEW